MEVSLRDITRDNWEDVICLDVNDEQRLFVASNAESIVESKFNPHCVPLAIYSNEKPVGFLMYEPCVEAGRPTEYIIYRFMVDKEFHGRGIGRKALSMLIAKLKKIDKCETITVCYKENSPRHTTFYNSMGFKELGYSEEYEEIIAEIRVKTPAN